MLLPPLTQTQPTLLLYTYRFRFLSRLHYQTILNHKSPSRIKSWLLDLTKKQFLIRERSNVFGENTKPTIYHLGENGIRYLKTVDDFDKKSLHFLYRESTHSQVFKNHCLTLADFCCNLLYHARLEEKGVEFFTKIDFRLTETDDELFLLLHTLNPDGYYSFSGTGIAKQCFIEIIDEITPAFVIRGRFRKYIRCFQDENWEEAISTHRFPSLVFIVPNEKKLRLLQRAITQVRNEFDDEEINTNIKCNIAFVTDIQTKSIADPIWKQA